MLGAFVLKTLNVYASLYIYRWEGYHQVVKEAAHLRYMAPRLPKQSETMAKLRNAGVHVAMRHGNKMRISPSVYNNQEDVSRLIEALA